MPSIRHSIHPILMVWIGSGIVRIILGSSTPAIAYILFAVFWLFSVLLLAAAIRQFIVSKAAEEKVEAAAICAGLAALFAQGLLGSGDVIPIAALVFLSSAIVLLWVYGRRLRRRYAIHS